MYTDSGRSYYIETFLEYEKSKIISSLVECRYIRSTVCTSFFNFLIFVVHAVVQFIDAMLTVSLI